MSFVQVGAEFFGTFSKYLILINNISNLTSSLPNSTFLAKTCAEFAGLF